MDTVATSGPVRTPRPPHNTRAWHSALAERTVVDAIPAVHLAWLTQSKPGARLVLNETTGEWGHVYPDVTRNPPGWTLVATREVG